MNELNKFWENYHAILNEFIKLSYQLKTCFVCFNIYFSKAYLKKTSNVLTHDNSNVKSHSPSARLQPRDTQATNLVQKQHFDKYQKK